MGGEVYTLLQAIEDMVDGGANVPFTKKIMLDKDAVLDVVKEIRFKLTDELKQAKWVKEERQRILLDAQKEAGELIKEAENRIIAMIDEHEITKKAYEKKAEIIDDAEAYSKELVSATKDHADGILAELEGILKEKLETVKSNRKELK